MNQHKRTLFRIISAIIFFFGTAFIQISYCVETGVVINADSIVYQKDKGKIEAKGSVEADYRNTKVLADHAIYSTKTTNLYADNGFTLLENKYSLNGKKLSFNMKSSSGSSETVRIEASKVWISGESASISKDEITIKNAVFSSCDLKVPHYKISAADMNYYPSTGWLVSHMGWFWVNNVPILPIPTYIYDTTLTPGSKRKNLAPLPEIGSNPTDGTYIHEKIAYALSSYSYGMVEVDYATIKGFGLGFDASYVLKNYNEGDVRLYYNQVDGTYGGITHDYYFGDDIKVDKHQYFLYQILEMPPRKKYKLEGEVSYRERINYERVSFLPGVSLSYNDLPLSFINIRPNLEVSVGGVSEESTGVNVFRANVLGNLDYYQPFSDDLIGSLGGQLDYTGYDSSGKWMKLLGKADIRKIFSKDLSAGAGYSHFFINDGGSPFRFENYRWSPYDEIRSDIKWQKDLFSLGVAIYYNSPIFTVKDLDYNATVRLHCFDLTMLYRAARNEFSLSVNLVTGD